MTIALFAVTEAGRRAAAEVAGPLGATAHELGELPTLWPGLDGAVFFLATGATVRLVAPLLADKRTDPGVVCVDEARRFAVALTGGHEGGANALATRVATLLGAQPVITTASDAVGSTGLDELVQLLGAAVGGDLAAAGTALLDGAARLENPLGFPLPPFPPTTGEIRHTIVITDRVALAEERSGSQEEVGAPGTPTAHAAQDPDAAADRRTPAARSVAASDAVEQNATGAGAPAETAGVARAQAGAGVGSGALVGETGDSRGGDGTAVTRLVPPTLVVGIGSARGVPAEAVAATLSRLETEYGLDLRAVRAYASVDLKAAESGILAAIAPAPLRTYPAAALAAVEVPNPSEVVRREVGTASVAEAAALHAAADLAAGAPVELVVEKIKGDNVTVAAARIRPRGRLAIVGLGPGAADLRVPRAEAELRRASIVVGLDQYVDQVRHLLRPGTEVRASGLGDEEQRAADAVALAAKGHAVALIGSGDAGVYAMASPALQGAGADIEVVGVPGVTAALAAASLLGAPLGHDHVLISLSDLHTPWEVIEQRVAAAAAADLVTCFYNPRSRDRHWQLGAALDAFRAHRPPTTPIGAVRQAGRPGQRVWTAALADFDPAEVDMLTTVVVGSSATRMVAGRMVTPRGYRWITR
ncbi:precorrin-3B C(17)-methyltransferase [Pseudonocardia sp. CA-142604]|uniref:precorrin-3B C(17)-methyltransferase n=1 Tax=Pseudonocardia sp. CA-142604 TaxID=3240024 RepID=UPI003D8CF668